MTQKRIDVDAGECMGYALCVGIAPRYFELDEAGIARVIRETVGPEDVSTVEEAAAVCPQMAIAVNPT